MSATAAAAIRAALSIEQISQAQLASLTGLTTKHVSFIMTGKAPISVGVAIRIERALTTVTAEDLMVAQARDQVRRAREFEGRKR